MLIGLATLLGVSAFLVGLYALWARRIEAEVAEGAAIEWTALSKNDPQVLAGYDEESFAKVYRIVYFPRFPGYALAAALTFLFSFPVILGLLSALSSIRQRAGLGDGSETLARLVPLGPRSAGADQNEEVALILADNFSGFFFFFGILISWAVIFAFFMARYHARRPGYLRDELIRRRPVA
ncbi:MAG: hypothetical protein AAF850_11955 [Pseudomonadota bacterium]